MTEPPKTATGGTGRSAINLISKGGHTMKAMLIAVIVSALLTLFGPATPQVAGDDWPGGSSRMIYIAGDDWPGGS